MTYRITDTSIIFDGMTWPRAGHHKDPSLEWILRYGSDDDLMHWRYQAASIIVAYNALINKPANDRNRICGIIKMSEASNERERSARTAP